MSEIDETLERWLDAGQHAAVATVINVDGSAPRGAGARMLIAESGEIAGSVSGGCVEGAVIEEAQRVLTTGNPVIARYGINRNMMWDVGLSCGGAIDVFIEVAEPAKSTDNGVPLHDVLANDAHARCTVVRGADFIGAKLLVGSDGKASGSTGDAGLDREIGAAARMEIGRGQPRTVTIGAYDVFMDVRIPEPRLIVVGAVHAAVSLCEMASKAGFAVIVVDPRPQLNAKQRFPAARRLVVAWPDEALPDLKLDENTYVAVLTHDEKFDDPTIAHALRTRAKYIGAIGSKKTQALRRERLLADGYREDDVDRLHAPIGLDIGAESPEEIAVAILAELIATKYGHRGASLRDREASRIHAEIGKGNPSRGAQY